MAEATPDTERLVMDYTEMWEEQAHERIPDLVSESFVVYNAALPEGETRGHDGLEEWMREVSSGFPDFEVEVRDLLAGEETVMVEVTYRMTHEGEFGGIPPTGRAVELPGMAKFRVEDGKMREHRDYYDQKALFEQLGVAEE